MKICNKCKIEKDETEFYKVTDRKSGLQAQCKSCINKAANKRNKLNAEYKKKYYKEYMKVYNKSKPEKYILTHIKSSAKRRGLEFDLTLEDIIIPEICPILGIKLGECNDEQHNLNSPSLDRIDNSKGYVKGNVMVISRKANIMKSSATKEELLTFSKYFINLSNS